MKKVLMIFLIIVVLTGCRTEEKTLEECMENYDSNDSYCSNEEHNKAFNDVLKESNLIEYDFQVTSFVMLSDNTISVRINQSVEMSKDTIESFNLAIKYVSDQLINNYEIDIVLTDLVNEYIFALNNDEVIGIIILDFIDLSLSEEDINSLNEFLDCTIFTDQRIRYGHVITGDDIIVENNTFIISLSQYEELNYVADELERVFEEYEVIVE